MAARALPRTRTHIERRIEERSDSEDDLFFTVVDSKNHEATKTTSDTWTSGGEGGAALDGTHTHQVLGGGGGYEGFTGDIVGKGGLSYQSLESITTSGSLQGQDPGAPPLGHPYLLNQPLPSHSCSSLVDGLLFDIYDRWHYPQRDSFDSDTFTECSSTSDAFFGRSDSLQLAEFEQKHASRYTRTSLEAKGRLNFASLIMQHKLLHVEHIRNTSSYYNQLMAGRHCICMHAIHP